MNSFSIELTDFEKVSTNKIYSGIHHYKRAKIKQTFLAWFSKYKNEFPKFDRKVNISMQFRWKTRTLDSSNCSYMAKMIEDCMVHYGILTDDTVNYVGVFSLESVKRKAFEKDNILLTIKELL